MFGGNRNNNNRDSLSTVMTPDNPPKKSGGGGSSVTGFDPEGLERAAKAARELDASRNASQAIELIKTQEVTKQHEAAAKRAEMEAYAQQQRAQNIEREAEEARKTLDAQTQHERHRAEYMDELERKRQVDMLNAQKYMQEEQLKKQEEMVARQEEMRRKTAEHEAALKTKMELAKAQAEADGRIRQERQNHDLILEKMRQEAMERRDTVLKSIQDAGKLIGEGLQSYLDDTTKLRNTALTVTGIAVGVYTARTSIGVAGRFVEARLGKPSLVRETSRFSVGQALRQPVPTFQRLLGMNKETDALKGIVLNPSLETQLSKIAVSTENTKKNNAPFRHLLLHGAPGTGKTMFARGLAHHSGLDYAILTGGDIAPLGRDAVTELHKLFDWAKTSRRGLLVFVDEADAFLQNREVTKISEDQRNALNAFLFRTGTESNQFMMVYASNQPNQFDPALLDRVDEMVEFDLPGVEERRQMIAMYIDKYLLNPPGRAKKVITEGIGTNEIEEVVKLTEGFSGRAISKLAIAWQAAAYGTAGAVLDRETFFQTVEHHKQSMLTKDQWLLEAEKRALLLTADA
ncbi:ATPase AAA [Nitzschia inconspicua]|uniref:ATPase AAA n=1 Tax=Nitzschia inconspicua TaxID=303405 RepID=A0A9K3KGS0_9STRA|nr:ATPase AAA [Nitzschia inconspicua]